MIYSVDRFEGNYAVAFSKDRKEIRIHRSFLPKELKETQMILLNDQKKWIINFKETDKIKLENFEKFNKLLK